VDLGSFHNSISDADVSRRSSSPADEYGLLAQANLLRIRGKWDEAIALCMEAMERTPGNTAAQSLLGDIYENKGDISDAIRWYRLALDSSPGSLADRRKLERLVGNGPEDTRTREGFISDYNSAIDFTPATAGFAGPIVLKVAAGICAAGIIGLTVFAVLKQRASGSAAAMSTQLSLSAPPVIIKPLVPEVQNTQPDHPRDPGEESLLNSLQASLASGSSGAHAEDILSDPRTGAIVVTVTPADNNPATNRYAILRMALATAIAGARIPAASAYDTWTVRYLTPDSSRGSVTLLFVGDVQRPTLAPLPQDLNSATSEQLAGSFTNTWWSSSAPP